MEREVFILRNGDSFFAWNVQFTALEQHRESCPCTSHEPDGSVWKGTLHYTLESAKVAFCAAPGGIQVGHQGQLSSPGDKFYDVTVSFLQPEEGHMLVYGLATRKFAYETDP